MKFLKIILCLFILTPSSFVYADTVLLLHGYLGSSYEWQHAGIVTQLDSAGWHNAGVLSIEQDRVIVDEILPSSTRAHTEQS